MIIMELTVCRETRLDKNHEWKLGKYDSLVEVCRSAGWRTELWTVEVGVRGFSGWSLRRWIHALGFERRVADECIRVVCCTAEEHSARIMAEDSGDVAAVLARQMS